MKIEAWQFFEYFSFALAVVYYRGLKAYSLQLMVPFLFYVSCSESIAAYYVELGLPTARGFGNVYLLVAAGVFFILFYNMIKPKGKFGLIYKIAAVLSMLFFAYDLFDSNIHDINSVTLVVSFIQQILLTLVLLFRLAFDEDSSNTLVKEPYFWIGVGILIFSLITIVAMGLQPFLNRNQITISGKSVHRVIIPIACVFLYSCYSYSFYLTSRTRRIPQPA